ncbi:uncharacterized protein J8A68_004337 [[Candida] subhashii]|uniref:Nucleolar protein Dnt1-like N-terminal domain-containing protein n=1 Tax=[Candida] subhashii TaxID=561895 RepID=A0A8J5UFZ8_9ASCO|nr:uncharacterized protein J8A68_004337 [[Candida] subhashii]KAG7662208.1 hypothetical protein J8A68_004337 [[Candida] subhashii]
MTKIKLEILIIPLNYANKPTSQIDRSLCKRFLHLEDPAIDLKEVKQQVETRYKKLYPNEDKLEIEGFQDTDLCDLDPDYCLSDVFKSGDILRVTVRNQFRSTSLWVSKGRLQGTQSPRLLRNASIVTGSRKRGNECLDNSDTNDSVNQSKTNTTTVLPQPKEHVSCSGPLFKPQRTDAIIVPEKKHRVPSSSPSDRGNGKTMASDTVSIPAQGQLARNRNLRRRGRRRNTTYSSKLQSLASGSSSHLLSNNRGTSKAGRISAVHPDSSNIKEVIVVLSESEESMSHSDSDNAGKIDSVESCSPGIKRVHSKIEESNQSRPKTKPGKVIRTKDSRDHIQKPEIPSSFRPKTSERSSKHNEPNTKPNYLSPKSDAVLKKLKIDMQDGKGESGPSRRTRRQTSPTILNETPHRRVARADSGSWYSSSKATGVKDSGKSHIPAAEQNKTYSISRSMISQNLVYE